MVGTLTAPVGYMGRKATHSEDAASIKVSRAVYRDIKTLAGFCGEDAGPWLTKFLEQRLPDELANMVHQLQERAKSERHRRDKQ